MSKALAGKQVVAKKQPSTTGDQPPQEIKRLHGQKESRLSICSDDHHFLYRDDTPTPTCLVAKQPDATDIIGDNPELAEDMNEQLGVVAKEGSTYSGQASG